MNIPFLAYQVAAAHDRLWAIHPKRAEAMAALFVSSPQAFSDTFGPSANSEEEAPVGVALIPLHGTMSRAGMPCMESASTIDLTRKLRAAAKDPSVTSIVLDVDSPGGTVAGTADFAQAIADAKKAKPVYAYVADMACSAAYWAVSQCTAIWASPNATAIGNIGVRAAMADVSEAYEASGVKVTVYASGPYKAMGAEGVPIPEEHHAEMQRQVDEQAAAFFDAVANGRGLDADALSAVTDGRWFTASEATKNGLIDKVGSLDDLYQTISSRHVSGSRSWQLSPAARPAASAPTPNKPMSKLKDLIAHWRGNPEAAKAAGLADETAIDALEAEAIVTPTTPEAAKPVVIPAEFEARIKAAESQAAAYRESIASGAAKAFAAQMVADRRMHSADKSDAEANYLDAARIDGGGQIALNDKGEIVEGEAVARIRRSYASRPQHSLDSEIIPNGDPTQSQAASTIDPARRTALLKMTPQGQKALAMEKN